MIPDVNHPSSLAGKRGVELLRDPDVNKSTAFTQAVRVATMIFDRGLAGVGRPDDVRRFVTSQLYDPSYQSSREK